MVLTGLFLALNLGQSVVAPKAVTSLVPSVTAIRAGARFSVALRMKMAPGWHSYYLNPGESGQATSITWHLPPGFTAGPIRWPVPKRVVVSGVAGYVYENEVWLVTDLTAPKNLKPAQSVTISADVNWLLCREACFPQSSKLSLCLNVGEAISKNPVYKPAQEGVIARLDGASTRAVVKNGVVQLSIKALGASSKGVQFFPSDPTYFGADLSEAKATPSTLQLNVPISKYAPGAPSRISGILVSPSGSTKGAHWIEVQLGDL